MPVIQGAPGRSANGFANGSIPADWKVYDNGRAQYGIDPANNHVYLLTNSQFNDWKKLDAALNAPQPGIVPGVPLPTPPLQAPTPQLQSPLGPLPTPSPVAAPALTPPEPLPAALGPVGVPPMGGPLSPMAPEPLQPLQAASPDVVSPLAPAAAPTGTGGSLADLIGGLLDPRVLQGRRTSSFRGLLGL